MGNRVVADVFDVLLKEPKTGKVVGTASLTDGSINTEVTSNEVRGGQGNQLFGELRSGRTVTLSLTNILFDFDWLAIQLGADVVKRNEVKHAKPNQYAKVEDKSSKKIITLGQTPLASSVKLKTESGQDITGFTVTAKEVDLTAATPSVAIGDSVMVVTYQYNVTDAQVIDVDTAKYPLAYEVVLQTQEFDLQTQKPEFDLEYVFYSASPTGNFEITTSSERQAQSQAMELKVFADPKQNGKIGKYIRVPVA